MSTRNASGSLATFYLFRSQRMTATEAHQVVRKWALETRSPHAPNPLSLATRKHLSEFYARPNHNTGD